ncbi:MAG: hypothetical protein GY765_16320, partial [bacterium]|nr:hypothetical protein [bacterium]
PIVIALIWGLEIIGHQPFFKDSDNHYLRLIDDFPNDPSLLLPLALMKAENKEYDRALMLVNNVLASGGKDRWMDASDMAGLLKANLLVAVGKGEKGKFLAHAILERTAKDDIKYFASLILAKYYEKQGRFTTALQLLKNAENIGETSDLFLRLTILSAKMKNIDNALTYLEKARALN